MLPTILSIRAIYGIVPRINNIPATELWGSPLRREVRSSLHFSDPRDIFYLPRKIKERLHLPMGLGLEVDYLA